MIHKVGLLPACNHQQIPFAYKMYTKADETGWKQSNAFKKTFSIDVEIHFVGVWLVLNPNFPPPPGPLLLKKKKTSLFYFFFQGYCQFSWIDTTSSAIYDF